MDRLSILCGRFPVALIEHAAVPEMADIADYPPGRRLGPRAYGRNAGSTPGGPMDQLPTTDPGRSVQRLDDLAGARTLAWGDLSDFFNPFLIHFVEEAFGGGGEVWVTQVDSTVDGLLIYNRVERLGSIFTRDRRVAEVLFGLKEHLALFSEFPLGTKTEVYHIYRTVGAGTSDTHRFRHRIRMARASDHEAIIRMMREMYGRIDTSWLHAAPRGPEKCLVVDVGDEIAGAGWVSVVNGHGRLHSLSVRPRFRRLGIGTDLWHARMRWAHRAGALEVISEISEYNLASQAIATAGGMERVGRIFLSFRPEGAPVPTSG